VAINKDIGKPYLIHSGVLCRIYWQTRKKYLKVAGIYKSNGY